MGLGSLIQGDIGLVTNFLQNRSAGQQQQKRDEDRNKLSEMSHGLQVYDALAAIGQNDAQSDATIMGLLREQGEAARQIATQSMFVENARKINSPNLQSLERDLAGTRARSAAIDMQLGSVAGRKEINARLMSDLQAFAAKYAITTDASALMQSEMALKQPQMPAAAAQYGLGQYKAEQDASGPPPTPPKPGMNLDQVEEALRASNIPPGKRDGGRIKIQTKDEGQARTLDRQVRSSAEQQLGDGGEFPVDIDYTGDESALAYAAEKDDKSLSARVLGQNIDKYTDDIKSLTKRLADLEIMVDPDSADGKAKLTPLREELDTATKARDAALKQMNSVAGVDLGGVVGKYDGDEVLAKLVSSGKTYSSTEFAKVYSILNGWNTPEEAKKYRDKINAAFQKYKAGGK